MADARELRRKLKSSKSSKSDDDELPTPKAPKSSKKLRPSADYQDHYLVSMATIHSSSRKYYMYQYVHFYILVTNKRK